MFFLAFLPQFVEARSPQKTLAFLLLGVIFIFNGMLWCLAVAAFAANGWPVQAIRPRDAVD